MFKMRKYADIYGSALPIQYTVERKTLENMRKLEVHKSFYYGVNVHIGAYDKINFKDYLKNDKSFNVDEILYKKVEKIYSD